MSQLPYSHYAELAHGVRIDEESARHINDNVQKLLSLVVPALKQSAGKLNGFHAPSGKDHVE